MINEYTGSDLQIDFLSGEYIFNEQLRINKKVSIKLKDDTKFMFSDSKGGIIVFADGFNINGGELVCKPGEVDDFNQGFGIYLQAVSNTKISNLKISQFSGSGIMLMQSGNKGCSHNTIDNVTFFNPDSSGSKFPDRSAILLGYSGTNYSHDNNIIENNKIEGDFKLHHGIALIGHGNNNRLKNNIINRCSSYGIVFYETIPTPDGYTINKNEISNNVIKQIGNKMAAPSDKGMGIYLMKTKDSKVIGNEISETVNNNGASEPLPPGGIALNTALNCIIQSNTVDGSGKYGIIGVYCINLSLLKNNITNCGNSALYLNYANNVRITDNTIISKGKEAIKLRLGSTSEVNLPKEAFKPEFYQIETGKDIQLEYNTIEIQNSSQAIFIDPESPLSSSASINILNNKFSLAGNKIVNNSNLGKKLNMKRNSFK